MDVMNAKPTIRYPEFIGDWREFHLGELLVFKNGLNKEKEYFGKGTPIINYMDVNKHRHLFAVNIKGLVTLSKKEIINFSVNKGDLFFTRTSETIDEIGYASVLMEDIPNAVFSGFVLRARPIVPFLDVSFCGYCFMTIPVRFEIIKRSSITTRALTSGTALSSVKVRIPSLPEQQKIASFLTLIDAKIDRQRQKVDALEEYKKGLLKKIFSQEIRFKDDDGNDYPDWRFMKFSDVYELLPTNSFSREKMSNTNGIIHNIHYGDIHTRFSTILDVESATIPYIINSFETTNFTYCIDGDLIIADASEDYKDIGKAIEIVNVGQKIIVAGLHTILARNTSNLISLMYSGYMMQSALVHKQIQTLAAGAKVLGISKSNIASIVVPIPDKDEQSKIVMLLHNLDNIISLENDKLDHLAIYKKGLLQQMFV